MILLSFSTVGKYKVANFQLAKRNLCRTATSILVDRIFSSAGFILNEFETQKPEPSGKSKYARSTEGTIKNNIVHFFSVCSVLSENKHVSWFNSDLSLTICTLIELFS